MKNVINYTSLIVSVVAIIMFIVLGIKIAHNNYNVIAEALVVGICLVGLFVCAVYNIAKKRK